MHTLVRVIMAQRHLYHPRNWPSMQGHAIATCLNINSSFLQTVGKGLAEVLAIVLMID